MRIAFLMSSLGGSPLTIGMERGLRMLGHETIGYEPNVVCDLVLVFNQCAHQRGYVYPGLALPTDARIAFIDTAEYGWTKRVHEPTSRYWNAFSEGSMEHDTKDREQQTLMRDFLKGRSFPYFTREYWNDWHFPPSYHPIDYPLYAHSSEGRLVRREQYLKRPMEVACLWGWSNPWREHLTFALEAAPLRKDLYVIERDGPRLPQRGPNGYFDRIMRAMCSISFDGYGSGSFRVTEVLCRALLMQGPLAIQTRDPLIHGETCWAYMVWVDGEHFVRTDLVQQIQTAMAQPERCYEIYRNGFEHCHSKYTERATAQYVLDVVADHDYSVPTRI